MREESFMAAYRSFTEGSEKGVRHCEHCEQRKTYVFTVPDPFFIQVMRQVKHLPQLL